MGTHPTGTVTWARDPTTTHDDRPVIVLAHEQRPHNATECSVLSLGSEAHRYEFETPELTADHLTGISFSDRTFILPWALFTIPPNALQLGKPTGELTTDGRKLVGETLYRLVFDAL